MNFTKDQTEAYTAFGENVIVSAGAGSGKTQVLSERVRYLVEEKGYHINEFLILTFTKLAAGEMKDRIRKKLEAVAPEEAKAIDNAFITTFDSYALSIVKKYHNILKVSKNISMIDENAIIALVKKKIDEIFDSLYENEDPIFLEMVKTFCFKDDKELKDLVYSIYKDAVNAADVDEYFEELLKTGDLRNYQAVMLRLSNDLDNMFIDLQEAANSSEDEKYLRKANAKLENYETSMTLDEKVKTLMFIRNGFPDAKGLDEEAKNVIKTIKDKIKKVSDIYLGEKQYAFEWQNNQKFTVFLVDIVKELYRLDQEYKKSIQCFAFSDIAKMAIKLLKENKDIADEIRDSLKTIMIDEYQDTSPIQESFISLISNNNVYMVGDVKQSIYRFRNATPEIFINKFNHYSNHEGGRMISLKDNFRSRPEVLDDINFIFSKIMTEELGGANYARDHIIGKGNKTYDLAGPCEDKHHSKFIIYEPDGDKNEQEARLVAVDIIDKINNHYQVFNGSFTNPGLRDAKFSDFCLLMDRGTTFLTYQKVFKEYKIPLFIENNENILNNEVVIAIIDILKLAGFIEKKDFSSPEFIHSYLSLARSFLFEIPDSTLYEDIKNNHLEKSEIIISIEKMLNETGKEGIYSFILRFIKEFKIYEKLICLGDIRMFEKYLDKFVSNLENLQNLGYTLSDYIDYFEEVRKLGLKIDVPSSSTSFDAVKIMNIFKSKGLEFPVIYCTGLTKEFNMQKYKKDFLLSKKYGIVYPNYTLAKSFIFNYAKKDELKEDLSEKIRLLYVEVTRAKEKVIYLLPKEKKDKDLEDSKSLGDLIRPYAECFEHEDVELTDEIKNVKAQQTKVELRTLKCQDVIIDDKVIDLPKRASKNLSFNSNKDILARGEQLHFYLEMLDFKNPDLSIITEDKDREMLTKFIELPLIKELKNPKFYKEYEFVDDINHTRGVIDCLIIDGDKAIIIDYKLKNIDDEHYNQQLTVYKKYVNNYFKMNPKCYLYSILTSTLKEISL